MRRVVIAGATGSIGRALADGLLQRGDDVVALSRSADRARRLFDARVDVHEWPSPKSGPPPPEALAGADAVVSVLGEPIAQRWSEQAKREIRESRVLGTRSLVSGIAALPGDLRPRALVSQSATGYYGPSDERPLDEAAPAGDDFLAQLVVEWEREALAAEAHTRVALTRTGVVLSRGSGALARMLPPFRLGIGGPVAGGRQYVPWVHISDVVGAMVHALDQEALSGPVNVTAPTPVTNRELARTLGKILSRPAVLPVPGFALRLLYGEMAEIVTTGQRVMPRRLEATGYRFRFAALEPALRDVLGRAARH
jgi:uncharacterized protein